MEEQGILGVCVWGGGGGGGGGVEEEGGGQVEGGGHAEGGGMGLSVHGLSTTKGK